MTGTAQTTTGTRTTEAVTHMKAVVASLTGQSCSHLSYFKLPFSSLLSCFVLSASGELS